VRYEIIGGLGLFDHQRMIEDLRATAADLIEDRRSSAKPMRPPMALLAQLGGDMLYATPTDAGGWSVRNNDRLQHDLAKVVFARAYRGALKVSWLHAAIALGRRDLRDAFAADNGRGFNIDTAVRWLVLHGVDEHRLWRFIDRGFIDELRARTIPCPGGFVSPLDMMLLAERADLAPHPPGSAAFASFIDDWIERNGVQEYKLFWALDTSALARICARGDCDERLSSVGEDADGERALMQAHDSGRLNIFVGDMARRAALFDGRADAAAADRAAAHAAFAAEFLVSEGRPLNARRLSFPANSPFLALDFRPGGNGLELASMGYLGRPTSEGAPILSPEVTLFLPGLRDGPSVFLVDMTLADNDGAVTAFVDGSPCDAFSAEFLQKQVAKIFASEISDTAVPTLELAIKAGGGAGGAPYGWLRGVTIFETPLG